VSEVIPKDLVLENLLQDLPIAFYWIDINGIFLGGNDKELSILGLRSINELVGKHNSDLCADPAWENSKKVMDTNKAELVEENHPNTDGGKTYFLSMKKPLRTKSGKVVGLLGISIDITDRKLAEQKLAEALKKSEAANEAKTQFLENMRHDIRTPLSGILGFAELIKAEAKQPKVREYADDLVASGRILFDFLDEVLDSIQAASGDIPVPKKKFNLKESFEKIISLNKAKAADKKLKLSYEYAKELPLYVVGDRVRLQRILLELTSNALKFTNQGGVKVSLGLVKRESKNIAVRLSVQDSGIGIPVDKEEDIFNRFVRLTPSFEGNYPGSGLGLSIVKQFVKDLDGTITVNSKKGKGSIFTCEIPLKEAKLQDETDIEEDQEYNSRHLTRNNEDVQLPKSSNRKGKKWRILLVEDDAFMGKLGKVMLERLGLAVDIATSGAKALELFQKEKYDLLLMDIGLPDMNGYEVTKYVRRQELKNKCHVPIVALSAHSGQECSKCCKEAGMDDILSKPLTPDKARYICITFIPKWNGDVNTVKKFSNGKKKVKSKSIDLAFMRKNYGNDSKELKKILAVINKELLKKIHALTLAYKAKDLKNLQVIAHKIRGLVSYCGAKRTQEACARLDDYLLEGKDPVIISKFYKKALAEIKLFQKQLSKIKNV